LSKFSEDLDWADLHHPDCDYCGNLDSKDVATGSLGGNCLPKKFISPPQKNSLLVVTSEFLVHFWPNWHQNNNKLA